uniref:Charged multivesicular body protein 4C n=2 Tax=Aquila chrysaetos chrysaetos TaxID=223781 RepID=A0A663E383_AQUCH
QRGRFQEAEGRGTRLCAPLSSSVPPQFPPRRTRTFKSRVSSEFSVYLLSPNPRGRPRPAARWQPAPVRPLKRAFRRRETGGKRGNHALRGRLRRSSSAAPGALPSTPRGLPRRAPRRWRRAARARPAARCGAAARGPRKCRHGVCRAGRRLLRAGPVRPFRRRVPGRGRRHEQDFQVLQGGRLGRLQGPRGALAAGGAGPAAGDGGDAQQEAGVPGDEDRAGAGGSPAARHQEQARDLNKIDDLMQDITEQQDVAQEISDAISNRAAFADEFDEDELMAELEELEQEELNKGMRDVRLPSVPSTSLPSRPASTRKRAEDEDEMKQLAAWAS